MSATTCDVSLGEGGPLRRFEAASHLTKLPAQTGTAILITWVPIVVIGAVELLAGRTQPLLHDIAMHVRFVVVIPVLLFLDRAFSETTRYSLSQFLATGVIAPAELPRFDTTLRRVRRLGDSYLPELVIALLAFALALSTSGPIGRGPAQLWYRVVALPLFDFLLLRSLWRWLLWCKVLVGLVRLELDLEPTHPDHRGGIACLRVPSLNYCGMLLFATAAVLCAEWGTRFSAEAAIDFLPVLLAFAAFAVLLAFGPLLLFIPQLARARRKGLSSLGTVAARAGRWCRSRWVELTPAEVLSGPEAQSFSSVVATYLDTVGRMRLLLVEKKDLVVLLLVTLAPFVVLMFATIPRTEWLSVLELVTPSFP